MSKLLLLLFVSGLLSCSTSRNTIPAERSLIKKKVVSDSTLIAQRQIMKDYVLCRCVLEAYKKDDLLIDDVSPSFYNELTLYGRDAIVKIDSFINEYVTSIKPSTYIEYKGKKATMFACIELYKSARLDSMISTLDSSIMK